MQGTGTALDGVTYTVNDRGGMIQIEGGVYHFDLLMSSNAECNRWGKKYGKAIIGGSGGSSGSTSSGSASTEKEKKDITTVVVKSVTGAAGTRKEILRDVQSCQMPGAELIIQNKKRSASAADDRGRHRVGNHPQRRGVLADVYGGQGRYPRKPDTELDSAHRKGCEC